MRHFRARRRPYGAQTKRKRIWIVVACCVLAAVLITVVVGNLLKLWLSDEAYQGLLREEEPDAPANEPQYQASVRRVKASPYVAGDDLLNLFGGAASVCVNTPDGSVWYPSAITEYFNLPTLRTENLQDVLPPLCEATAYVSCVFYPQAFDTASDDLFFARTSVDCALMREWILAGGDEILLCDVPLDNLPALLSYLQALRAAVGEEVPVGVAIPLAAAQAADAWETMGELLRVCDFLALDLRDSATSPADCDYYLEQYDMRLLLFDTQEEAVTYANQNLANVEIITPPPTRQEE